MYGMEGILHTWAMDPFMDVWYDGLVHIRPVGTSSE